MHVLPNFFISKRHLTVTIFYEVEYFQALYIVSYKVQSTFTDYFKNEKFYSMFCIKCYHENLIYKMGQISEALAEDF